MLDKLKFSNEDTFFLTFIATWCSTSKTLWNSPMLTIMFILFSLFFIIILAQIKFWLINKKKEYSIEAIFALFFMGIIGQYMVSNGKDIFSLNDVIVLVSVFILWALLSCLLITISRKKLVEIDD